MTDPKTLVAQAPEKFVKEAAEALKFLATNQRPIGGEDRFNSIHLEVLSLSMKALSVLLIMQPINSPQKSAQPGQGEREAAKCKCGMHDIPAWVDIVSWYWQQHTRDRCSVDLPNERCWCGLLRSEHVTGHADRTQPPAQPEGWTPVLHAVPHCPNCKTALVFEEGSSGNYDEPDQSPFWGCLDCGHQDGNVFSLAQILVEFEERRKYEMGIDCGKADAEVLRQLQLLLAAAPQAPGADKGEADEWYLQDKRSFVGNDMLFWAKDGKGYTTDLRAAHVYTKAEAESKQRMRITDVPWPKTYIDSKARPAVDMQYVKKSEAALLNPEKE